MEAKQNELFWLHNKNPKSRVNYSKDMWSLNVTQRRCIYSVEHSSLNRSLIQEISDQIRQGDSIIIDLVLKKDWESLKKQ